MELLGWAVASVFIVLWLEVKHLKVVADKRERLKEKALGLIRARKKKRDEQ